jgi:hypothetical protein
MSSNSVADTLASVAKKVDAKPAIVSPAHFGDLGKAANDTFSKVHFEFLYPFHLFVLN